MSPYPCYTRHSQNFDKTVSFLRPVLNTCILGNMIVGWLSGFLKRGLVFCIKSIDLVEALIFWREEFIKVRIGIIQTSKAEIAFGYKPLTFYWKAPTWMLIGCITLLKNTFYVLLVEILYLEKKVRNIYTRIIELTFPREDVIN